MKSRIIISMASIFLCFWYMTAIVGLDVHIDHHDGEVYVISLLNHTDCESLHPEDECHCFDHHHGHCHENDEDCENVISLISLTGDGFDIVLDIMPVVSAMLISGDSLYLCEDLTVSYPSIIYPDPPREHLRSLRVLRV